MPTPDRTYQRIFRRENPKPWLCCFCGKVVEELFVHHDNGDRTDNRKENLKACHELCHIRHHKPWEGRIMTDEYRAKLSEAGKRAWAKRRAGLA